MEQGRPGLQGGRPNSLDFARERLRQGVVEAKFRKQIQEELNQKSWYRKPMSEAIREKGLKVLSISEVG